MYFKEEQRAGRNKETAINSAYIESGEYRRKFDAVTDSKKLNRLIYCKAKEMLYHRNGTLYEDMYWFDAGEQAVIAFKLDETIEQRISHTRSIDKLLATHSNIIAMHTHPRSMPPSANDFNNILNDRFAFGIVICHNGKIYLYKSHVEMSDYLLQLQYEKLSVKPENIGKSEMEIQLMVLQMYVENGDIELKEV